MFYLISLKSLRRSRVVTVQNAVQISSLLPKKMRMFLAGVQNVKECFLVKVLLKDLYHDMKHWSR